MKYYLYYYKDFMVRCLAAAVFLWFLYLSAISTRNYRDDMLIRFMPEPTNVPTIKNIPILDLTVYTLMAFWFPYVIHVAYGKYFIFFINPYCLFFLVSLYSQWLAICNILLRHFTSHMCNHSCVELRSSNLCCDLFTTHWFSKMDNATDILFGWTVSIGKNFYISISIIDLHVYVILGVFIFGPSIFCTNFSCNGGMGMV